MAYRFSSMNKMIRTLSRLRVILATWLFPVRASLRKIFNRGSLLFNIDLHIGVIPEIQQGLKRHRAEMLRFSISGHNRIISWPFPIPDRVDVVNAKTWRSLSPELVQLFRLKFKRLLSSADGFVVTLPTSFVTLFSGLKKPILGVIATRFDSPFESDPDHFDWLLSEINKSVSSGELTLIANNRADSDFAEYFLEAPVPIVPSLCDKGMRWSGSTDKRVIISRSKGAQEFITSQTDFRPISELGSPYPWESVMECLEVLVIPQNVSTMTLFELATAGVPVVVPGRNFVKSLRARFPDVLGELTFAEIAKISEPRFAGTPMDWRSDKYLDWWLDRADFYDLVLMPNVRVAESISDLNLSVADVRERHQTLADTVELRNEALQKKREKFLENWLTQNNLRKQ